MHIILVLLTTLSFPECKKKIFLFNNFCKRKNLSGLYSNKQPEKTNGDLSGMRCDDPVKAAYFSHPLKAPTKMFRRLIIISLTSVNNSDDKNMSAPNINLVNNPIVPDTITMITSKISFQRFDIRMLLRIYTELFKTTV